MSDTIKALREQRAQVWEQAKELNDKVSAEERDFSAEEQQQWDRMNAEMDEIGQKISLREEALEREKDLLNRREEEPTTPTPGRESYDGKGKSLPGEQRGMVTEEDRSLAIQGWMLTQEERDVSDDHVQAALKCGVNLRAKYLDIDLRANYNSVRREVRALQVGTDSEGGYTVPEGFVSNLEQALLHFGGMRQVADVIRTDEGNELPWPTANDTSNEGEIVAEEASIETFADPVFSEVRFGAHKYSSKAVKVSAELLQDSGIQPRELAGFGIGRADRSDPEQALHQWIGLRSAYGNRDRGRAGCHGSGRIRDYL